MHSRSYYITRGLVRAVFWSAIGLMFVAGFIAAVWILKAVAG